MPRITKVYTRTGDDGTTGLGTGERVPKTSPRIGVYGMVDELNSHVGVALALGVVDPLGQALRRIQNDLFHLGSDLCVPESAKPSFPAPRMEARHVAYLEELMDGLSESLAPLENFILPGGTPAAAALHVCRTVCRRTERAALELAQHEAIGAFVVPFLNRLSDAFFVMARYQNHRSGVSDPIWNSRA